MDSKQVIQSNGKRELRSTFSMIAASWYSTWLIVYSLKIYLESAYESAQEGNLLWMEDLYMNIKVFLSSKSYGR